MSFVDKQVNHQALWLSLGIALGACIGVVTDQIALGVAFGAALGIFVGSIVSKRALADSERLLSGQIAEIYKTDDWEESLRRSEDHPVLILKHSTTCPVSARAYREFAAFVSANAANPVQNMEYRMVNVIESRPLSRRIAEETEVRHESPQVLLLSEGKVIHHASHSKITKKKLLQWAQEPF